MANSFKDFFASIFVNSKDDVSAVAKFNSSYNELLDCSQDNNDFLNSVDTESIEICIKQLKTNKASGFDGIVTEHIINSHPSIVIRIKLLFQMIMLHACVPKAFGFGIITPVVKDRHGDLGASDN